HKAHNHTHEWTTQVVDTGHGHVSLSLIEEGAHNRFQLRILHGKPLKAEGVKILVPSHNGQGTDIYNFIERDGYL
ncbi:nickel/cobalt efflux protein RcnA, partial [Vibrio cholerae]|nr:nickel/cobalt efflux protein RcnA [Vibrio cholerae]